MSDSARRVLDLSVALVAMALTAPVLAIAVAAAVLREGSPVIFRQQRVGQDLELFEILKLRTMDTEEAGPGITARGDRRVTPTGRVLRQYRLDELPQLWNVIRGDMALVGPRPELPEYVTLHREEYEILMRHRPGITSPASIEFYNEELILSLQDDPEHYYVTVLLPRKLDLELEYMARRSVWSDLTVLAETARAVVRS